MLLSFSFSSVPPRPIRLSCIRSSLFLPYYCTALKTNHVAVTSDLDDRLVYGTWRTHIVITSAQTND